MRSYVHNNSIGEFTRGTIAMEVPDKSYLETVFSTHATHAMVNVGYTLVHPRDQFNKKKGKDLSDQRLQWVKCCLNNIEIRGTKHVYHFLTDVISYNGVAGKRIEFAVSTVNDSKHTHLIYGYFKD